MDRYLLLVLLLVIFVVSCKHKHNTHLPQVSRYYIEYNTGLKSNYDRLYDYWENGDGVCGTVPTTCFGCGEVIGYDTIRYSAYSKITKHTYHY